MDYFLVTPPISLPQFLSAAETGNEFGALFSSCAVALALTQREGQECSSVCVPEPGYVPIFFCNAFLP